MSRRKINPQSAKKKQIFIFSEWETEVCYFQQLKSIKKSHNIKVSTKSEWQLSWIDDKKLKISQDRIYEIIWSMKWNFNKRDIKSTKSKIFYLLDIDWYNPDSYNQDNIDFIRKNFEDENITVLYSNKDIELWILLHFSEYKKEDWKYIEEILKISWYKYEKGWKKCNIDFFEKIINENLETALDNARKLSQYQTVSKKRTAIKDKNPYTEVYKIFEEITFES